MWWEVLFQQQVTNGGRDLVNLHQNLRIEGELKKSEEAAGLGRPSLTSRINSISQKKESAGQPILE